MHTLLLYLTIVVMTLGLGVPVLVATALGVRVRAGSVWERFPNWWARAVMWAAGARIVVHHSERLAPGDVRVYVANHVSWFDIFAIGSVLPRYRFVAKRELLRIPVFGPAVRHIAAVFVDRHNRSAAFDAYREAAAQLGAGTSVVVCPEGTRGLDYALRPFKKGAFVLAIAAQVPVVPVVVYGTREMQPKGRLSVRPGTAELVVLDPVPTAGLGYGDRDALVRTVWERMAAELRERYGVVSRGGPFVHSTPAPDVGAVLPLSDSNHV